MAGPYKRDDSVSYTLGAFATLELLQARPEAVRRVYLHSRFDDKAGIGERCRRLGIPTVRADKPFARLSPRENCYVIGEFAKYGQELERDRPHLVLVNPSDQGNLGTIARIAAGFGIASLGIVTPAADLFHPKTVRASMGAVFRIRCELFSSFEQYRAKYARHRLYPFLLNADRMLTCETCPQEELFTLVFGSEAAGLEEDYYSQVGTGFRIPQSELVDSLNLAVAAGIGAYVFARKNGLI
ncbi:TrmH family RNA methyltransferase [Gorillibacterium sp. sgz500922]|uniref:TrmH family RNA methyltransferase n=1 Tax=Gorillibacterium sp. sgz500922 TaxID=3446694 RepID=UPI003F673F21